ncbi:MAG: MFS transporter [Mycobacteriales bacterium]
MTQPIASNSRSMLAADRGAFRSLRIRNFRLYFFGQICSITGNNAQTIAIGWLILQLTGSGTMLGLVTAAQFLPLLVLSPLLGSLIDRFSKRYILMITQLLGFLVATTLWVITAAGRASAWEVCALALVLGAVNAIDNPTRQTLIREMVGSKLLLNAAALNNVLMGVARIAGPGIAGVVIAVWGIPHCFFLNAVSFLVILAALAMMTNSRRPSSVSRSNSRSLRSGFRYAASTPDVRWGLILMALVGTFTYEFWVTLPILVKDVFGQGSSGYAAIMMVMSVGSVAGGLLLAARLSVRRAQLGRATMAFGVTTIAVGISPTIEISFVTVLLMGGAYSAFVAVSSSTFQLSIDEQFQGRVMALWTSAFVGSTAIGGPIMGWIAQYYGARSALVSGGLVAIAAAWLASSSMHTQGIKTDSRTTPSYQASR